MTFVQRRNRLRTHFSERIPVVKRRMTVVSDAASECVVVIEVQVRGPLDFLRRTAVPSVAASGATHPTTQHHTPQDRSVSLNSCGNIETRTFPDARTVQCADFCAGTHI